MKSSTPDLTRIFISYSHKDRKYLDELLAHLTYYEKQGNIDFWDDTKIRPGSRWHREIVKAIASAKIAILLVSPDYLTSKFIAENELPPLLQAAEHEGVKILLVILRPGVSIKPLDQFQSINKPSKPLSLMNKSSRDAVWEKVVEQVQDTLASKISPPQSSFELSTQPITQPANTTIPREPLTVPSAEPTQPITQPANTTIYTYRGHSARVNAVRWSPDGKQIASASDDGTVQIWDATTGSQTIAYQRHAGFVFALAWSPDGRYLASGGDDNAVQVVETMTGKILFTYSSYSKVVAALDWSPDGKFLVFGSATIWPHRSEEDTVQVVEAFTGKTLFIHHGPSKATTALSWSPNGRHLASAGYNGTVEVLIAGNGSLFRSYQGSSYQVDAIAWSPDNRFIASGGDDGIVQVWDTYTENVVYTYGKHSGSVLTISWSPDGQYIASAGEGQTVQVWNVSTGETIFTYYGHAGTVLCVAWSPDGQRIASAGQDKTVQIWQVSLQTPQESKEQWLQEGNVYYQAKRYEEALAAYEQAIRLDSNYARSYQSEGEALTKLQRYEEALATYDQAIRLDPKNARSYHNKGVVLSILARYREAQKTYEQALRLAQALGDVIAERNELQALGNLHTSMGQLEEAERYYREAREAEIDDPKNIRQEEEMVLYQGGKPTSTRSREDEAGYHIPNNVSMDHEIEDW
jgi:WD40 repeat protein